jgi:blue copper oxidase
MNHPDEGPTRRQVLALGLGTALAGPGAAPPETLELRMRARPLDRAVDPASRATSRTLRYEIERVAGPPGAVVALPDSLLGPTLRLRRGQRVRVRFDNALDEPSIVHWHGLEVAPENDGHPRQVVAPGATARYEFEVVNRPGTYWYHPHPDGRTGAQVYSGLAGLIVVSDDEEDALGLPSGDQDLPIVIQDRVLDRAGRLVYDPNPMTGLLGDRVFINGRADPSVAVRAGSHRLRLLNGSNARIYKLAWSDGAPLTVIATDGGLLAAPVSVPYVMLAPGQRVELWADLHRDVSLVSRSFFGGGGMMGMRGMGRGGPPNGAELPICQFVVRGTAPGRRLPARLAPMASLPAPTGRPRRISVGMGMMRWLLNGRTFDMEEVADNERLRLGRTEEWVLSNDGGMMPMPHPIHLHGPAFRVVERTVAPAWEEAASGMRAGLIDEGWRDTVLLMPGERVRLWVRHERYAGLFLYHCHNLEHEDVGMMRNFVVEA